MAQPVLNQKNDVTWINVQGIVTRGYGKLRFGRYVMLRVLHPGKAKAWLALQGDKAHSCVDDPETRALNIAITAVGLLELGAQLTNLNCFSEPFMQGMVTDHRSRILGDHGPNDPKLWTWGQNAESTPHVMVALFAVNDATLGADRAGLLKEIDGAFIIQFEVDAELSDRDHFNFVDGISQPKIDGVPKRQGGTHSGDTATGEMVLGHVNSRDQQFPVPVLGLPGEQGSHPFGYEGTYLVFRQMEQKVLEFHEYCATVEPQNPEWVAAQFVGREPDGTPLVLDKQGQKLPADSSDFDYSGDSAGFQCPIGAHIRRSNPRDSLLVPNEPMTPITRENSLHTVSHHRIMRRGRIYGPVWRPGQGPYTTVARGLNFICLNASIADGFELVQQSWLSNTKFNGLYDEVDPMVGISNGPTGACAMTIQMPGLRRRLVDIPRFIIVMGGAYFFLPSRKALTLLAQLPDPPRKTLPLAPGLSDSDTSK